MDAIETLMTEHRLIEAVLDAMVGFADEIRRRNATDKEELGRFVAFLREFADGCHHGKEEDVLFAAMVANGFPKDGGPIAVMLHEHTQGRALIRALARKAEQAGDWSGEDRQAIADAAAAYGSLLHAHIHKEDAILYPMAEQHLPPEAMERVGEDCARFEAERTGSGEHERLHALAEGLVARHAATGRPTPVQRHAGCC
ncbi:MAG TPA: hemerythrin domain-containing protein [Anaeromyxobacteraceae bacterium]|nr:hemerythrin domain-containing protein [Anaeromyxobacteraceae bacterium]